MDDLDALADVDRLEAERLGLEDRLTLASANFHARSGHSFVLERDGEPAGFILAHAVWNGVRPIVRATRVTAAPRDVAGRVALVETLTKSAYDAAVYDLEVEVPDGDAELVEALEQGSYEPAPRALYRRVLGSRGAGVAAS